MIHLFYGKHQQFRLRHGDINILGVTNASQPVKRSQYQLNDTAPVHFYIEPEAPPGKGKYAWNCKTPSIFRLRDRPGSFNIEIPVDNPALQKGLNRITIEVEDFNGAVETLEATFQWNSQPVTLPISLSDFTSYESIQEIGQVVNGLFEIDRQRNCIVSCKPVGADILFLVGSPGESQEATYDVEFDLSESSYQDYAGLSDFFARHEEQTPGLGIKPGYCTSGLSTISPAGEAKLWMAVGDCLTDKDWAWVIHTENPSLFKIQSGVLYRVRHQVIIHNGVNWSRYKIWKKGEDEPHDWLCDEDNAFLRKKLPRIDKASFGLFQFGSNPTSWSNISVQQLKLTPDILAELERRKTFRAIQQKRVALFAAKTIKRAKNFLKRNLGFMRHQEEFQFENYKEGNYITKVSRFFGL